MSEYLIGLTQKEITALDTAIDDLVAKQRYLMSERDKAIKAKAEIERLFASTSTSSYATVQAAPAKRGRKPVAPAPVPETAEKPKRGPIAKPFATVTIETSKMRPDSRNAMILQELASHPFGLTSGDIAKAIHVDDPRKVSFNLQNLKQKGFVKLDDTFWKLCKELPANLVKIENVSAYSDDDQSYGSAHNSGHTEDSVAA